MQVSAAISGSGKGAPAETTCATLAAFGKGPANE